MSNHELANMELPCALQTCSDAGADYALLNIGHYQIGSGAAVVVRYV